MSEVKSVEVLKKEISVPKEISEAIDFIAVIAQKLKDGASYTEFTDTLGAAMTALQGSASIPTELKSEHKEGIAAYLMHKVGGVFL